ncbi:hypothetical protein [Streptomyces cyaneogriseus]|nr:hypothetical protein [Streptomyces cyaneogriseus]
MPRPEDQPASIGALALTGARDAGCQVAHLPGTPSPVADGIVS